MILKRFYHDGLAQASYLIGCAATGEALVVDPNRDVEQYVEAARRDGVRVTHVTETHIHADFVSGSRELAERTGAQLFLSDEGGADWRYTFAQGAGATLLRDGDSFAVGNIRVEVLHTPGHTPEHLSFLVTDTAAADHPMGILTGDFVFVGAVGRPDLLERAVGIGGAAEGAARQLFRSIERFKMLPEYLQVWPGHGAGSACGKGLGAVPQSTVGYEKLFNPALAIPDEQQFVRWVLESQTAPPRYFAEMKRINRDGPRILDGSQPPERQPAASLAERLREGALVVDVRNAADYAAGHVPGTINVPLNKSFTTWAGSLLPYDRDIYLLVDDQHTHSAHEAVRELRMIGLDRVAGVFGGDALAAGAAGRELDAVPQVAAAELRGRIAASEVALLDVRNPTEWEAGRLPDAPNVPLASLAERWDEIPTGRPLVVYCQGGARSAIAASVLKTRGIDNVINLTGGFVAWQAAGGPTRYGPAEEPTDNASTAAP